MVTLFHDNLFKKACNATSQERLFHPLQFNHHDMISQLKQIYPGDYIQQKIFLKRVLINTMEDINVNVLMEFYTMEGDLEELKLLVEQMKHSDDEENRLWAKLYELKVQYISGQIQGNQLIDEVMQIQVTTDEMKVFSILLHLYGIFNYKLYEPAFKISQAVYPLLKDIENDYLRNSYSFHLDNLYSAAHLYTNKVDQCRALCELALEQNHYAEFYPIIYSNFFHLMSLSYTFESFDYSMSYLTKAKDILTSHNNLNYQGNIQNLLNSQNFLESLWGKNLSSTPLTASEQAHRHLARNNKDESIRILRGLYREQHHFTPYQEYYFALATGNEKRLRKAKEGFLLSTNYFYLKLFEPENLSKYPLCDTFQSLIETTE